MVRNRSFKLPSVERRPSARTVAVRIVVFCEGKKTEPAYLRAFADHHGNGRVEIECVGGSGTPKTIVSRAIERKKNARARGRRELVGGGDQVWAMFDRDDHPFVLEARDMAQANGVPVAFSNPCFEVWGLLHYVDHGSPDSRHEVQKKLSMVMPNYHHDKNPVFDFEHIRDRHRDACRRALRCLAHRHEEGDPHGNPSTTVHELLDVIIKNSGQVGAQTMIESAAACPTS